MDTTLPRIYYLPFRTRLEIVSIAETLRYSTQLLILLPAHPQKCTVLYFSRSRSQVTPPKCSMLHNRRFYPSCIILTYINLRIGPMRRSTDYIALRIGPRHSTDVIRVTNSHSEHAVGSLASTLLKSPLSTRKNKLRSVPW